MSLTPETLPLLAWTPPSSDRFGGTFERAFDFERLNAQQTRVFALMKDGLWRSLREISTATGDPEASVSARLRDLRREEFGGLCVERRRRVSNDVGPEAGLFEYRIDPKSIPKPTSPRLA